MAWTFVKGAQKATGGGASNTVSFASAVANGSVVTGVIFYNGTTNAVTSVTDDKSNTYTVLNGTFASNAGSGGFATIAFWSGGALTNGPTTITVNVNTTPANLWITSDEFTPPAGTLSVDVSGNGSASGSSPTLTLVTTANGDLIYSGTFVASVASLSVGSGFTITENNGTQFAAEFLSQTTAASTAVPFTTSDPSADAWTESAFAIKAVSSVTVIEAEQFIGKYTAPTLQRARPSWSVDGAPFVLDTVGANPHFIGRFTAPVFNRAINSWDIQGAPFVLDQVGANPHFIGKFAAPAIARIPLNNDHFDLIPTLFDTPVNFVNRFQPTILSRIGYSSYDNQGSPQVFATEIPVNFVGKTTPVKFFNSVSYLSYDTGVPFIPPIPPTTPTVGGRQLTEEDVKRAAAQWLALMRWYPSAHRGKMF